MTKTKRPFFGKGRGVGQLIVRSLRSYDAIKSKKWGSRRRRVCCDRLFWVLFISLVATATPVFGGIVVDRVMAIVNDEIISLYELNQRILPYIERIKKAGATADEQEKLLRKVTDESLSVLIDEKLADQEIKRLNIQVGASELKQEIERFKSVNRLTDEDLRVALEAEGSSLDEFGQQIKEQILRARLVNREIRSKIVITHEEVVAYFEKHPEEFGGEKKYLLKNIVMISPEMGTSTDRDAVTNRLKEVRDQLIAGEKFDVLARKYSEAPNAESGGSLGLIGKSALAPNIQMALESLKPHEFTDIIDTDQGYQIFYIEKIEIEAAEPFDKVKEKIEDKLYKQVVDRQYEKWLQDLRTRAHIKLIK